MNQSSNLKGQDNLGKPTFGHGVPEIYRSHFAFRTWLAKVRPADSALESASHLSRTSFLKPSSSNSIALDNQSTYFNLFQTKSTYFKPKNPK